VAHHEVPMSFQGSLGPKLITASMEEIELLKTKYRKDMVKEVFSCWARDIGFVQNGEKVCSLSGNRWNLAKAFPTPRWVVPNFEGGNFLLSGANAIIMEPNSRAMYSDWSPGAFVQQLKDFFGVTLVVVLPMNHFAQCHADLVCCFVAKDVLASRFSNPNNNPIIFTNYSSNTHINDKRKTKPS
jgi:hypothetical protein